MAQHKNRRMQPPSSSSQTKRSSRLDKIKLTLDSNVVYGREIEQMELDRIVRQSRDGPQYVAIHGAQGVGKSALVRSMKQSWMTSKQSDLDEDDNFSALFISSTFDKHEEESSFGSRSALVEALEELCREWSLTANGEAEIEEYLSRVHHEEEVIHRSIPTLYQTKRTSLLNKSTRVWSISVESAEGMTCLYRKKLALQLLLASICRPDRPVILFLDDFQYADPVSIDILSFFLKSNDALKGLVVIVAYRDVQGMDEDKDVQTSPASEICPGIQAVTDWKGARPNSLRSILVRDLCVFGTSELIHGATKRDDPETTSLAEVVYHKTGGNPFYICQFLRLLQDEGYLFYSLRTFRWEWCNADEIQEATSILSDNVAEMVTASIEKLPCDTIQALMVASCLGKRIPFQVLRHFFDEDSDSDDDW